MAGSRGQLLALSARFVNLNFSLQPPRALRREGLLLPLRIALEPRMDLGEKKGNRASGAEKSNAHRSDKVYK